LTENGHYLRFECDCNENSNMTKGVLDEK